jgi:hypothetical protein
VLTLEKNLYLSTICDCEADVQATGIEKSCVRDSLMRTSGLARLGSAIKALKYCRTMITRVAYRGCPVQAYPKARSVMGKKEA